MTIKRKNLNVAVVMLAMALMPLTAQATNFTWTGGGSGANAGVWTYGTSPYNWSGGSGSGGTAHRYPGQNSTYTDTATINSATNGQVTLAAAVTLGGPAVALTIGSSAVANALTVNSGGNLSMKGDVSNLKNITLNTGGALTNADATAHTISGIGGTITLAGGGIASSGGGGCNLNQAVSGYGTISAPVTNNSSLTANNATALILSGGVTNSGTGILTAASGGTLSLTSALANSGSVNVASGGTLSLKSALTNSGSVNVATGGTLTLGTGASLSGNAVNVSGTVTNSTTASQALSQFVLLGGTLNGTKGYSNSGTWGGSGSIQNLTNTGTLNANNSGTPLALTGTTNNTGGTLGSTGGTFTNNGTINNGTVSANVVMTGGALSATSGTMTLASTISGAYSVTASSGAQIALNGAHLIGPTALFNYITLGSSNTSGPINLTGDSEFANNFQVNGYSPINVNGNTLTLTNFKGALPSGTYLNVGTGNLNINGPASVSSGGNIHLAGGNINGSDVNTLQGNVTGYGNVTSKLLSTAGNLATASGGTLYISGGAELSLPGGTYNNGSLSSSTGATLVLASTINNSQPFTSYVSPNGGTVNLDHATLSAGTGAAINLTAGTVNVTNDSTLKGNINSAATLTINSGKQLTASRGANVTLTGGGLTNNGTLTLDTASLNNNSGATLINNGTVNVHNSTVNWGNLNNNGAIISDPSTQIFNNLTVGAAGYLTGAAGDVFTITGNFVNNSAQSSAWNTLQAALAFATGTSSAHSVALGGADLGRTSMGFTDNFAWNSLDLTGQTLTLTDGNATPGGALYVADLTGLTFSGDTVTDIIGNGLNVYYDPSVDLALGGKTFNLEGGGILAPDTAPVPEPGTMVLLGLGFLGLAAYGKRFKRV